MVRRGGGAGEGGALASLHRQVLRSSCSGNSCLAKQHQISGKLRPTAQVERPGAVFVEVASRAGPREDFDWSQKIVRHPPLATAWLCRMLWSSVRLLPASAVPCGEACVPACQPPVVCWFKGNAVCADRLR